MNCPFISSCLLFAYIYWVFPYYYVDYFAYIYWVSLYYYVFMFECYLCLIIGHLRLLFIWMLLKTVKTGELFSEIALHLDVAEDSENR